MSDSDQILCLGDIILDTYCEGLVERIESGDLEARDELGVY